MDTIRNTESLTRFLRSKDSKVDEIYQISLQLLRNDFPVSLPHNQLFIFELIIDRLNDNSKFSNWKFQSNIWDLFHQAWTSIDNKLLRDRTFRRLNFLLCLTKIFLNFFEISDSSAFHQLLKSCRIVLNDFELQADESTCINFFTAALNIFQTDLEPDILTDWLIVARKIYRVSFNDLDYTPSKKVSVKFLQECLPLILSTIQNLDSDLDSCKKILTSIVEENIFGRDLSSMLPDNISSLLKKNLPVTSITILYTLIVENIGTKNAKLCEEIFLLIIKNRNYQNMAGSLISILSATNRPLSTPFFESVLENTLNSKPIDWTLIGNIVNLDASLATDKSPKILDTLNNEKDEIIVYFADFLVKSFVRARDLDEFYLNVWLKNINCNKVWSSHEIVNIVSKYVDDLSSTQLVSIINHTIEKSYSDPEANVLVLSISKGLNLFSSSKVDLLEESFFSNNMPLLQNHSWELKFNLLLAYPNRVQDFQFITLLKPVYKDVYYFLSIFRFMEVTQQNLVDEEFENRYLTLLDSQMIELTLKRWCVIISTFFSDSVIAKILSKALEEFSFEFWEEFLTVMDHFFELPRVTSTYLNLILHSNDEKYLNVIRFIPIECINRGTRIELINKLTGSLSVPVSETVLINLLSKPTFKSKIETDFMELMKYVFERGENSYESFKLVWNHHLLQAKSDSKFVSSSLAHLTKVVLDKKCLKFTKEVLATGLITTNTDPSFLPEHERNAFFNFQFKFLSVLTGLIGKELDKKVEKSSELFIEKYLSMISEIGESISKPILLETIKSFGFKITNSSDRLKVHCLLFKLMTIVQENYNFTQILAVYSFLYQQVPEEMLEGLNDSLSNYCKKMAASPSLYDYMIFYVLQSLSMDLKSANVSMYMNLLNCLILNFQKDQGIGEKRIGMIISIVLNKADVIMKDIKSMQIFLKVIKTVLSTKTWCFSQYSIEQTLNLVTRVGHSLNTSSENINDLETTHVLSTQVVSHILLFHRFRLNSRHHLINACFIALLSPLTLKGLLSSSTEAASALTRLISNLCEPSNLSNKRAMMNQLTTSSSIVKKNLRGYLPILLVNYIHLSITFHFNKKTTDELMMGIFTIFDVLSQRELETTNSLLDSQGTFVYKTLYNDYRDHGKWKDT